MTGGWEIDDILDISLLDIGHISLAAGVSADGIASFSALASAMSPSITVSVWDVDITLTGHILAGGIEKYSDPNGFRIGGAWGFGGSVAVSW